MTRDDLVVYIGQYLSADRYIDYAPNGLQVEGKSSIQKIMTAVTASLDAIEAACDFGADALLVHHGYFWKGEPAPIVGMKKQRVSKLLQHDINLLAYHLPLDCHPLIGNNAMLAKQLGLGELASFKVGSVEDLLWIGTLATPLMAQDLCLHLEKVLHRAPVHLKGHDKPIHRIAFCTGGAQDYLVEAHRLGADAYLSGEISERTYYEAKEYGIDYFAAGHHATERYGIEALGQHLAQQFGLMHQFYDSHNPV